MLIAVAIVWLTSCGCSSIRVPAIDPTGAGVFAPVGSYTTFESPCRSLRPASCFPRPAFAEPPPVPNCQTVAPAVPRVGTIPVVQPRPTRVAALNVPNRLLLTPSKIVAPVGSEVVLLAGLCGPDGYFVAQQPLEWLLSQESVGHFVDVGQDDHPGLSHLFHRAPERRSSNFAVARTSSQTRTITRGTPTTNDDILLQRGQAWVTLTAATEGISHVTAIATDSENWEQRRQTATIQWVDAQWLLPAPTVVRAGQSQILTTTVNRSSSRAPARGWLVRYTVLSGPPAGFGPERAASVEVMTDANGKASVPLQPLGNEPGVTQVQIEILSPASTGLDGQPVVVGQGVTSVTWSTAGLAVQIIGPVMGTVNSTLDYQIEVTNPGDLATENVVVTAKIPPRLRVIGTQDGAVVGANVEWRIDTLPARGVRQFQLQCRAIAGGDVRLTARAAGTGVASESHFDTQIVESALRLSMELAGVENPDAINVGDRISFNVEVTNTSNVPLTNVQLLDSYATGLQEAHDEPNPISKHVGNLAPGASQQLAISFIVRQPGRLCHTLRVTADGGHSASVERCIQAGAPRYDFSMELRGPEEILTGDTARYEISVTNTGDAELTGLRIVYRASESLLPKRATENYRIESGALVWTIGSLGAGQSIEPVTILCDTVTANNAAETRVLVSTDQGLTSSKRITTAIRQASAPNVAPPGPPRSEVRNEPDPPQPAATEGTLRVTIADENDPIRMGQRVRYVVEVENTRPVPDKNLFLTFYLPENARFVSLTDAANGLAVEGQRVSPDRLTVTLGQPIREIRPREKLPAFLLDVEALQAGTIGLRVELTSVLTGNQPVIASADTRVNAN